MTTDHVAEAITDLTGDYDIDPGALALGVRRTARDGSRRAFLGAAC
jgi:hypothetical protein